MAELMARGFAERKDIASSAGGADDLRFSPYACTTGALRSFMVGFTRTGYMLFVKSFARYSATPHKLFRPENPTVLRFEEALNSAQGIAKVVAEHHCDARTALVSKGTYSLMRLHGFRLAVMLKARSILVNSLMGGVLFGCYDFFRSLWGPTLPHATVVERFQGGLPSVPIATTAWSATLAGALHGAICAPLEVAALRLQAAGPSQGPLLREIATAVWRPLPRGCERIRLYSGALVPLGVARDALGICGFFVTFEVFQDAQHRAVDRLGTDTADSRALVAARVAGTALAGGCAGAAYRVASWPYDLLIVRSTVDCEVGGRPHALVDRCRGLLRELGWRRMFLPPARVVASAMPTSALGLMLYEALR